MLFVLASPVENTLSYVEILRKRRFAYVVCIGFTNGEYLVIRGDSKETAFGFGCLYWLHQWGIPYRTCRFYCCLAAHQRTRKKDSAEPSFPILWTPPHPPGESAAAGKCRLPRVYTNLGIWYQVLSLLASFEYCAAFCVRAGIVRVSVGLLGLERSFFIIGGWTVCSCGYGGFCYSFS